MNSVERKVGKSVPSAVPPECVQRRFSAPIKGAPFPVLLVLCFLVLCSSGSAWALPFNQDMVGGQYGTGSIMRPKDPNTVPTGRLDRQYPERKVIVETWENPLAGDPRSPVRGARLFAVHCAACHGAIRDGQHVPSDLMAKGIPSINLLLSQPKFDPQKTDGYLWAYIYWGMDAIMPRYGYKMAHKDIWDLVSYIRKLQQDNPIG